MKVLFVSSGNKNKGISPIVGNLGRSLVDKGIDINYFVLDGKGIKGYIRSIFKLREKLRDSTFDILHAHYGLSGIVAWCARRNEKIIVSYMGSDLMGSDLTKFPVKFFYFLLEWIYRVLSNGFFDYTIVKSDQLKIRLGARRNISVIPGGVNLDQFIPVEYNEAIKITGFDINSDHVIFVSDPKRKEKNFRLAQDAVSLITGNIMQLHAIFNTDQDLLKYYYSSASLLVLTSFYEGSPNVVKEAMACNCPVVSTDVGDVSLLFIGMDGYYISAGDKNDLFRNILLAIEYRKKNGQTYGRERILALGLDDRSIAKKISDIYKIVYDKKK